ncbi:MAG: hypothetical protein R2757_18205 [Draconibacterium sp.]
MKLCGDAPVGRGMAFVPVKTTFGVCRKLATGLVLSFGSCRNLARGVVCPFGKRRKQSDAFFGLLAVAESSREGSPGFSAKNNGLFGANGFKL